MFIGQNLLNKVSHKFTGWNLHPH